MSFFHNLLNKVQSRNINEYDHYLLSNSEKFLLSSAKKEIISYLQKKSKNSDTNRGGLGTLNCYLNVPTNARIYEWAKFNFLTFYRMENRHYFDSLSFSQYYEFFQTNLDSIIQSQTFLNYSKQELAYRHEQNVKDGKKHIDPLLRAIIPDLNQIPKVKTFSSCQGATFVKTSDDIIKFIAYPSNHGQNELQIDFFEWRGLFIDQLQLFLVKFIISAYFFLDFSFDSEKDKISRSGKCLPIYHLYIHPADTEKFLTHFPNYIIKLMQHYRYNGKSEFKLQNTDDIFDQKVRIIE